MSFFRQLRKRKVLRALAAYLIVAWLVVQVLDVVGPAIGMPDWFMTFTVVSLAIGLPVVAAVSWFFELTSDGLRREREGEVQETGGGQTFSYVVMAMLAAALGVSLLTRGSDRFSGPEPAAARLTVAVLPLEDLGGHASDDGFVDGLHDDLLTVLSRIESLRVISRKSVLPFASGDWSMAQIGQRLGAGAIVEGSVQRSGDRIRVNVQLIDADEDDHIWAEIFERPFDARAIFAIQQDIAQAIARNLSVRLTGEDLEELERQPTASAEAYSAYLIGLQRLSRRTSSGVQEAEEFFRRAIGIDPAYADAWAGLAHSIVLQHSYASLDEDRMLAEGMRAVQRALELQPRLSSAHAVLGQLRVYTGDYAGAEEAYLHAVALNPNNPLPSHWLGTMLYSQGRFAEALVWHRRALELDPLSAIVSNTAAQDLLAMGRHEEAAAQYQRSLEIDPQFVATYAHLSQLQRFAFGRPDEAVRLLYTAYLRDPAHSEYAGLMAEALLELDDRAAAARWAERATETAPDHYWPSRAALLLALRSGEGDAIDEALEAHGGNIGPAWLTLSMKRDRLLDAGEIDEARGIFVEAVPDFLDDPPVVGEHNFYLGPTLAVVHLAQGREDAAEALLSAVLEALAAARAQGHGDFDLSEVEARALLGQTGRALDLLEEGLEHDWMPLWWYARGGATLEPLHDEPRFIAVFERIEARMQELRGGLEERYRMPPSAPAAKRGDRPHGPGREPFAVPEHSSV